MPGRGVCVAVGMHGRRACMGGMHGGGCMARGVHGRGACMAGGVCGGGHAWHGGCVWQRGIHGRVGSMRGRGACVAEGHAWQGRERAWQRGMRGRVGSVHGRYNEIRSMSGRYAFYWNAFLL